MVHLLDKKLQLKLEGHCYECFHCAGLIDVLFMRTFGKGDGPSRFGNGFARHLKMANPPHFDKHLIMYNNYRIGNDGKKVKISQPFS